MVFRNLCIYSIILITILPFHIHSQTNTLWANALGNSLRDIPVAIRNDSKGNILQLGMFQGTVDFDPGIAVHNVSSSQPSSLGVRDNFLLSLDSNGNFNWVITFDKAPFTLMEINFLNDIVLIGTYSDSIDFDPGPTQYYLPNTTSGIKSCIITLNSNGSLSWAKVNPIGIFSAYDFEIDVGNNINLIGLYTGTIDFDPDSSSFQLSSLNGTSVYIQRLSSNGSFVFAKQFKALNINGPSYSNGFSISSDVHNNLYIGGSFLGDLDFDTGTNTHVISSTTSGYEGFTAMLDSFGLFRWVVTRPNNNVNPHPYVVADKNLVGIYTIGSFIGTIDFDPSPSLNNISAAGKDLFIQKLDTGGNLIWVKTIESPTLNEVEPLGAGVIDKQSNIYIYGKFKASKDFDPSIGSTFNMTSTGIYDGFVLKLDSLGQFNWAKNYGGNSMNEINGVSIDFQTNLSIIGSFNANMYGNQSNSTFPLSPAGDVDIFTIKIGQSSGIVNLTDHPQLRDIKIFPNPFTDQLKIKFNSHSIERLIKIYDSQSKLIYSNKSSSETKKIDLDVPKGYYYLQSIEKDKTIFRKLIKL